MNVFGRRLYANGFGGAPDIYEINGTYQNAIPVPDLNFTLSKGFGDHFEVYFRWLNILDFETVRNQEFNNQYFITESYRRGTRFALGFNYINSFMTAVAAETTQGWELISNPFEYLTSRIKNIMDILMFFGPVLIVLCYKGFKSLKNQKLSNDTSAQLYHLVSAAIITLLIIFALGAYDHGETARAAMFIYPFLLIPVAIYMNDSNGRISRSEMGLLLLVVFGQGIFMQLIGNYVW